MRKFLVMTICVTTVPSGEVCFGPEVIELFSCPTQLSIKCLMLISIKISRDSAFLWADQPRKLFFPLINVKMPTICWHFNIYEQENFHAQLS